MEFEQIQEDQYQLQAQIKDLNHKDRTQKLEIERILQLHARLQAENMNLEKNL